MTKPPILPDRIRALPVNEVLDDLAAALATGHAVLEAPPGAGKTTLVPLRLLNEDWLDRRRIVMLEPRRMAARAAARRMASLLDERVGDTVGYRTRLDTRVGQTTRIEVVTEGILVRMLQNDPSLDGVGLVIFDEFHERSVTADLGLALTLDARDGLRPDLRLLVMSATLDGGRVAALLGDAPRLISEGRSYPVEVRYRRARPGESLPDQATAAVRTALAADDGDILVFLPGVGEIQRVADRLDTHVPGDVAVLPLHGSLADHEQDRAIRAAPNGQRKVILSTPIAETSLTIDGVRIVVDGGYCRSPRFSPATGLTRLETTRISLASAEQRRGRAGRLGPGVCYRLWSRGEQDGLARDYPAAILEADLAPLVLELAVWGTAGADQLDWLDPPPGAAWNQAADLLRHLDAVDERGIATAHGCEMAAAGFEPRLAHMLIRARDLGAADVASRIAALLSERDPIRFEPGHGDADIALRLEVLDDARRGPGTGARVDANARRRILATARDAARRVGPGRRRKTPPSAAVLIAMAWPDRIAGRRGTDSLAYRLASGRGAALPCPQPLASSVLLAVAALGGRGADATIHLAAALEPSDIDEHFAHLCQTTDEIDWDTRTRAVVARRQRRLGAVVLDERPLDDAAPDAVIRAMLDGIRQTGPACLPWTRELEHWRARVEFLAGLEPDAGWPDLSADGLLNGLDDWLGPWLEGMRRLSDLRRLDLDAALKSQLDYPASRELDRLAPARVKVPSGSSLGIDYAVDLATGETPVLAVRLQEMFGATETPTVAGGRVPLTLHLLSPAGRPVQVTRDLASFWSGAYHEVRKDLRGRYPKHHWPEDPLAARPTRHAKRRRR